jgi:hypothetical protein
MASIHNNHNGIQTTYPTHVKWSYQLSVVVVSGKLDIGQLALKVRRDY